MKARSELCDQGYVNISTAVLFDTGLSLEARMLWCVLRQHAQSETGACWPSFKRLQEIMCKSENVIRAAMNELVSAEHIERKRRGRGATNVYTFKDLRTSSAEVQDAKILSFSGSRTSPQEVVEPQQMRGEVLTNEILPKEVASAATSSGKTTLQIVCEKLGIKKDIDAEELVERSMANLPDTDHIARSLRCKGHYPDWSKKSEMKRAGHFANFCETEKNPRVGYTITAQASNGGVSPTDYVRHDTEIKATIPQFRAVFKTIASWGTCTTKRWAELETLGEMLKPDGTLLFLVPREKREKVERLLRHDIDMACRQHNYTFAFGAA